MGNGLHIFMCVYINCMQGSQNMEKLLFSNIQKCVLVKSAVSVSLKTLAHSSPHEKKHLWSFTIKFNTDIMG